MNKVCHYVITHFDNQGNYYLNKNLLKVINKDLTGFIFVINNVDRVSQEKLDEVLDQLAGNNILLCEIESISQLRNVLIENFLSSDYDYMTMIDGDDEISMDYHTSLVKFSDSVELFGIFNGEWVYPDGSFVGIFHQDSSKLIKYAQHYTNWLYIYCKKLFSSSYVRYPDIVGFEFPEDEYFYSLLASLSSDCKYVVPVLNRVLYKYLEGNSKVAKLDTSVNKQLAEYLGMREMIKYRLIN